MPEWIAMLLCFALLFIVGGFVLLLHVLDILKKTGDKAMLGAAMVYLVERFKK